MQYSVRDFASAAAGELGVDLEWQGEGAEELARVAGFDRARWPALGMGQVIIRVDPDYFRPTEVQSLLGDASKARAQLGWAPEISFHELVAEMAGADLAEAQRDALSRAHGHRTYNQHE